MGKGDTVYIVVKTLAPKGVSLKVSMYEKEPLLEVANTPLSIISAANENSITIFDKEISVFNVASDGEGTALLKVTLRPSEINIATWREKFKPKEARKEIIDKLWLNVEGKQEFLKSDEFELKKEKALITKEMLEAVAPGKGNDNELIKYLNEFAKKYKVNTKYRIAHFISQVAHESSFLVSTENLNYSKNRMRQIFGCKNQKTNWDTTNHTCLEIHRKRLKLWTNPTHYANNSENLANYVYGDRMGNGNEASGDGYKYRGRGLIQLTGKDNYKTFTKSHNNKSPDDLQNFENNPDLIVTNKKYGVESAFVYWDMLKLNDIANGKETEDIKKITIKINGGTNGLEDRATKFKEVIKQMERS